MKKTKILSLLLALAVTGSIFAGCGTKDKEVSTGKQVSIKFMETLTSPDRTEYVKSLIKDFESKNPNIKVELVSVPWEQAHDKIMTQIATNQAPDVVEMAQNWLAEMTATGKVENLQPYFDKWEEKNEITTSSLELVSSDKKGLYVLPYGLFIRGMFYREDFLKEKNIQVPKTYDELFKVSEQITDASKNRYGYSFRGGKGAWTQLINTIMTEVGTANYFDKDGKCVLRDPKAIEAFKKYADLYKKAAPKDALNWGYNEKVNAFTSGITGFLMQDSEVIASCEKTMKAGTWATAPLPVGPDGKRYLNSGYIGFSMFTTSKNKEASWKLISYLMSSKINTEWNKKTNTMPVMKAAIKDEFFSKGYMKAWADTAADSNTVFYVHPDYLPEWGPFFAKDSVTELQNYLLGKQSAEDTMNKWADILEKAYKTFKEKNK